MTSHAASALFYTLPYMEVFNTVSLVIEQCFSSLNGFLAALSLILCLRSVNLHSFFLLFLFPLLASLELLQPLTLTQKVDIC